MWFVIGMMLSGVGIGYWLRRRRLTGIHRLITVLIWILLFLLGVEVGGNERIVKGLLTLGADALLITSGAVLGSSVFAWLLWRLVHSGKEKRS